jgi:hypothetical protein
LALDNEEPLSAWLSREMLAYLAELFHVRLEWLTGSDERAISESRWTADRFRTELATACRQYRNPTVTFVRTCSGVAGAVVDDQLELPMAVIRREHVTSNSTRFVTLQVWRFDRCLTEKSTTGQIAEVTAACRAFAVSVTGIELSHHVMRELGLGVKLPVELLSCLLPQTWDPAGPWEQVSAALQPVAATPNEASIGSNSEPATTIDLYAMLARQQ